MLFLTGIAHHESRDRSENTAETALPYGMRLGKEAAKYYIPRSTVWDQFHRRTDPSTRKGRLSLTIGEEQAVVELLLRHNDQGVPLT